MGSIVLVCIILFLWFKYEKKKLKKLEEDLLRLNQISNNDYIRLEERFISLCRAVINREEGAAISIVENSKCDQCGKFTVSLGHHKDGRLLCPNCMPKRGSISL